MARLGTYSKAECKQASLMASMIRRQRGCITIIMMSITIELPVKLLQQELFTLRVRMALRITVAARRAHSQERAVRTHSRVRPLLVSPGMATCALLLGCLRAAQAPARLPASEELQLLVRA